MLSTAWLDGTRMNFDYAFQDVEGLLGLHDSLTERLVGRPPGDLEVFKRAGVILAITAWETFVEDALRGRLEDRLRAARRPKDISNTFNAVADAWLSLVRSKGKVKPENLADWAEGGWKGMIRSKFEEEIAALNTPDSANIERLSRKYIAYDVTDDWRWASVGPGAARERLDALIKLRGNLVHQARTFFESRAGVRRSDLAAAINLVKRLVDATQITIVRLTVRDNLMEEAAANRQRTNRREPST